ncbi:reverse transcriptase domain-containing protein [Tanacetum coccineum]
MPTEMELTLEQTQQGVSYKVSNIRVNSFTMKMEILLEPTSNKLMVEHAEFDESNANVLERFYTSAGNPVKEILLKLNLPDHRILKDGGEVMSPPARASRAKFHWGIAFATGLKPKLTKKKVGRKWILVREMMMISKDGEISIFPEYHSSEEEEEPTEQPRSLNKYGFDEDEPLGYEAFDKEVKLDLESTTRSKPKRKKLKKTAKAIPDRTFRKCAMWRHNTSGLASMITWINVDALYVGYVCMFMVMEEYDKIMGLEIIIISSNQLQNILPQIVTQVTNNVNIANGGNGGNGGKNSCTYKGFMACNPKEYDGKGGAIALTRWIDKMKNVIDNSGCAENQKVKYVASSFMNKALTWWNTQVQARGREAAIGMSWTDFKALLVEEFCPSNEMEKLEYEFWNHKMVGANHAGYTDRFHELAKLVPHLVTPESSRIKSANLRAGILTDEAVSCGTLTKGNEKRKGVEETSKQGTRAPGQVGDRLTIEGNQNTRNNGNQFKGMAFSVNAVGALQDPNVVTGTFSLNNHYAAVLFDSESDFSFISTDFAPLLNVKPSFVNLGYVIEVADGKKVEIDRIIRDCKLELGNSMFTIDLIPLGHGSFDVIVGMDWLSEHKAKIVCHEKVVRIPLKSDEILHIQGERTLGITKDLSNVKVDEPKFSDISIVRDFVEVFLED